MLSSSVSQRVVCKPRASVSSVPLRPRVVNVPTCPARKAVAFASREGSGDSDAMSAPMDIQPEQQEVFYTDETLQKETPDLPSPTGESSGSQGGQQSQGDHHFDNIVYKVAHEAPGAEGEGGRFDEEPMMPAEPYSPKPSERGHGVPPHKDASNTGPSRT